MPAYEFRCRTCDVRFEVRRALSEPVGAITCPQGHPETSRIYSAVALGGRTAATGQPAPAATGGGCCGGGCCG
ncbi:MAG: FmdB family zinc ribbon protein [Actinomycetota bacterium]